MQEETRYKIAATNSFLATLLSLTFPSITISKLYSQSIWIEKVFTINAFYFAYVCVQWVD